MRASIPPEFESIPVCGITQVMSALGFRGRVNVVGIDLGTTRAHGVCQRVWEPLRRETRRERWGNCRELRIEGEKNQHVTTR